MSKSKQQIEIEELKATVETQSKEIAQLDKTVSELTELVMTSSSNKNQEISYLLVRQAS